MLSDEEKKALEQAGNNITRGNDIESAMLILEKCALDGVIFIRGRINVFKIAVRQILNFLEEYKDKGYLDVVREKVKANETVEKQSKEIEELKEENKKLTDEYLVQRDLINPDFLKDYISKDKIKVKIEYKKDKLRQIQNSNDRYRIMCLQVEIDILQSLLEKE